MKNQIANIITGSRILCSILILFCPVFSVWFYATYLLCGSTDMVDGTEIECKNEEEQEKMPIGSCDS